MASQSRCTLHKLPREMRDKIYEFAQQEWVKDPIIWSEKQVDIFDLIRGFPTTEPVITYANSSALELALIPDKQLYREALESRLKQSTLVFDFRYHLDLKFTDSNLSKLARKCIKSVVLPIPKYFRKVISPGYGYVMDSWQFGGLHDNEEVAQRLPFMILRTLTNLAELRNLTLHFYEEEGIYHSTTDDGANNFAAFVADLSSSSSLETQLKQFPNLMSFKLKVLFMYDSHTGAGDVPGWMLEGINPVFTVEGVSGVEDLHQDSSQRQCGHATRVWQVQKEGKLVKEGIMPAQHQSD